MIRCDSPYGQRNLSGCALTGFISRAGRRYSGDVIKKSICLLNDRGNGLGAGFAAYGIYPQYKDLYAFHIMYDHEAAVVATEHHLGQHAVVEHQELIRTHPVPGMEDHPSLKRYFLLPRHMEDNDGAGARSEAQSHHDDDLVVRMVMHINEQVDGAYVFSSGKNMGAFKGVGLPRDIAEFYRIEEYEGYLWTAHHRFPTNTPGWWGGAHPFTLLDWSIVHNGEISSYGINKRYLEMFGYRLTLLTDTEVITYLFDLLVRRHGLDIRTACMAMAPPFWKDIEAMAEPEHYRATLLRQVYGSAALNGPFAVLFAYNRGLVGFNDRVKLRPLVAGVKGDMVYMSSEESAIRILCPDPERVWAPRAGEPLIAELYEGVVEREPVVGATV